MEQQHKYLIKDPRRQSPAKDIRQTLAHKWNERAHVDEPLHSAFLPLLAPRLDTEACKRVGADDAAVRMQQGDNLFAISDEGQSGGADEGDVIVEGVVGRGGVVAGREEGAGYGIGLGSEEGYERGEVEGRVPRAVDYEDGRFGRWHFFGIVYA